jgi:hydroxypyruvate reductase
MSPAEARARLRRLVDDVVVALAPAGRVADALARIDLGGRRPIGLAIGKAACAMACGAPGIGRGLVIAPARGPVPAGWAVVIGAHPRPDERSARAGQAALTLAATVPATEVLIALVSGGASALAAVPAAGTTLAEKRAAVDAAIAAGAPIAAVNAIRAARSAIKGGRLARACPAPVVTLVASDVVGDDPEIVGSGPTVGPWTTRLGAAPVALDALPIVDGRRDAVAVIAGVADLARTGAAQLGPGARAHSAPLVGDVAEVAALIAGVVRAGAPGGWVASGEATIALGAAPGQGGRAQHTALLVARALAGVPGWACLCVGSDGRDGTGPAAGAIVDGATWGAIGAADGAAALAGCDSGRVLAAVGATVVTGATGINHADLTVVITW